MPGHSYWRKHQEEIANKIDIEMIMISVIILIAWNMAVFAIYGIDKHAARRGGRRISEGSLLLIAALMGGIGAFFGMRVFRHKTKHLKFKAGVPLLLILNIVIVGILIYSYVLQNG